MSHQRMLDFILQLQRQGWSVHIKDRPGVELIGAVRNRYEINEQYLSFLENIALCVAPDDKTWFLCEDDYNGTSESAFRWNEFERLCLDAADDDPIAVAAIEAFWSSCLPIVISVSNGYSYLGILTRGERRGKIVRGSEPDFEETEVAAESFVDFLGKLAGGLLEL